MSKYDVVVIGAGVAGLTTACQLAQANKKVLAIAYGAGALLLASGCVDVLGFQPTASMTPVKNPLHKIADFLTERPDHPYRLVTPGKIESSITAFQALVNAQGLDYRGSVDRNWLLPGTVGAVHPTCLAPISLANGELSRGGRLLIVGFKELRDFYPTLISQNLNAQELGVTTEPFIVDAPAPIAGELNTTPIELARAFDKPEFRQALGQLIKPQAERFDRIGFPAVLGLEHHADVLSDLESQLGKTVFEISTLPPSVPGRRLFEALRRTFLQANGRLIIGSKVADGIITGGKVDHIRMETSNRLKPIHADNYVLATGGIYGGGLKTDDTGKVWEPIFGLPIDHHTDRHQWFAGSFLSPTGQPVNRYGVKVNERFNPVNGTDIIAQNLYVVGSTIAGTEWTQGRTGDGVSISTAYQVAETITGVPQPV